MEVGSGARGMDLVLLHEINAGTFARLYLAEIRGAGGIDRIVAVKILREQWKEQQDIVNRTRDEARLLGRLRHKNILRVEDLVEVDGQTAIIMEYVDGLDLKQLVDGLQERRQRLPAKVALDVVLQAASALEAAYFRVPTGLDQPLRVVHRDVKPSNIMLSSEGEVRVLDFGTARSSHILRSAQTGAMRFGSLKYMSPERREGDRGEHAGDVYALGLVLLELLGTDWLPLLPLDPTEHDEAIAHAIARLDSLGMPNEEWDLTLRQMLAQMLAGEPGVRPDAGQVVALIRAFVEQASGPMLDRFAQESVLPLSQALRAQGGKGDLSGRRVAVQTISADPPAPRSVRARAPAAPSQALKMGIIAVGTACALLILGVGVPAAWRALSSPPPAEPSVAIPVAEVLLAVPTPPVPDGVSVSVGFQDESAQWVALEANGVQVAKGKGSLDVSAPAGSYEITVKLVGRPVTRGILVVPTEGIALLCASDPKQNVRCTGGKKTLTLRP